MSQPQRPTAARSPSSPASTSGSSGAAGPRPARAPLLPALGLAAAGLVGLLVALEPCSTAPLAVPSAASHPPGAYRPDQRARWAATARQAGTAQPGAADDDGGADDGAGRDHGDGRGEPAALGDDRALPPELEARLRATAHVATVAPAGAPPPPAPGSLPPASEIARQQALVGWQREVQAALDRCVARPVDLRKPTPLDVILAPPSRGTSLAQQLLAPAAVSLPPDELRRLWRDTDPEALDGCLREVRALVVAVTPLPGSAASVMPASIERLVVSL